MKLTEKLYWYPWQGMANNCNSYLYKGEQVVLFDPGHIYNDMGENCLDQLINQLSKDGFSVQDIDLILCTHGHPDHVESVGTLRDQSGARFGVHRGDEFILDAIAQHYAAQKGKDLPSLQPDFFLEEGKLDTASSAGSDGGSGDEFEVIHTPGHSPGCVCFYLPDQKTLVSGDTIFEGSIGRADLPGGDMNTLGQSVDKLSRYDDVEKLLPGHMGYIDGAQGVRQNFEQIKQFFFR